MHKLGIWSLSNHFVNKVLPSIKNNSDIKITKIYTKKKLSKKKNNFKITNSLDNFLKSDFDVVYISSVNSNHFSNCKIALKNKKDVICEKPICLKPEQIKKLKNLAKKHKKKFLEINQYTYHPLFKKIKYIIKQKKLGKLFYVKCSFEVPLKDKRNFRFNKKLGGGALYDVGYYPLSTLFTLFNSNKINILKKKITKNSNIDLKGETIITNENNIIFDLSWSFKDNYKNFIYIYGEKGQLKSNFIFSKKIIQDGKIEIFYNRKFKVKKTIKANQINLAFNEMLKNSNKIFKINYKQSLELLEVFEKLKKF